MLQRTQRSRRPDETRANTQPRDGTLASSLSTMQQTAGNQATTAVVQRLTEDTADDGSTAEVAPRSADVRLQLHSDVGPGCDNLPGDVQAVRVQLDRLGYDPGLWLGGESSAFDDNLDRAIREFQRREVRMKTPDGVVSVGGNTHSALAIGRQAGAGDLDAELGPVVDESEEPLVVALRARVADAQARKAALRPARGQRGQEVGAERDALVALIGEIRAEIDALASSGLPEDVVAPVSAWAHRRLNEATPYYEQYSNADFLEERDDTRTCNLSCLAMCLEALGVTSVNYTGDREVLDQIRGHNAGGYDYAAAFRAATDQVETDAGGQQLEPLDGLRLPDFLQLVLVGRHMEAGMQMQAAANQGWKDAVNAQILVDVARRFGVAAYPRPIGFGSRDRDVRQRHVEVFGGLLDRGSQVIVGVGGHFARLQSIQDDGIVVDDPAKPRLRDTKLTWDEADGYIKSSIIIG